VVLGRNEQLHVGVSSHGSMQTSPPRALPIAESCSFHHSCSGTLGRMISNHSTQSDEKAGQAMATIGGKQDSMTAKYCVVLLCCYVRGGCLVFSLA